MRFERLLLSEFLNTVVENNQASKNPRKENLDFYNLLLNAFLAI